MDRYPLVDRGSRRRPNPPPMLEATDPAHPFRLSPRAARCDADWCGAATNPSRRRRHERRVSMVWDDLVSMARLEAAPKTPVRNSDHIQPPPCSYRHARPGCHPPLSPCSATGRDAHHPLLCPATPPPIKHTSSGDGYETEMSPRCILDFDAEALEPPPDMARLPPLGIPPSLPLMEKTHLERAVNHVRHNAITWEELAHRALNFD